MILMATSNCVMSILHALAEKTLNLDVAKTQCSPCELAIANVDFNNLIPTSGDSPMTIVTYAQLDAPFPVSSRLFDSSVQKIVATSALPAHTSASRKKKRMFHNTTEIMTALIKASPEQKARPC